MKSVEIYGRSDDLIEVDGDGGDEFGAYSGWWYLHFSDGTVVKMGYDQVPDKGWHIEIVTAGTATSTVLVPEFDGDDHYTDRLRLDGDDLGQVDCWQTEDGPSGGDIENWFDNLTLTDYPIEKWRQVMKILRG